MTNGSYFGEFKYKIFFSPLKKKTCVEVSFFYNDKPIKRFIFIDKDPGVNYIQEAKRIIKQEIESGELEKYCKRYGRSFKPVLITALTAASLVVVAGAGYLGYKYLAPGGGGGGGGGGETSFTASIVMSEPITGYSVSLTNEKAVKDQIYSSDIKLHYPTGQEPAYVLPSKLEKVKVGGQEISDSVYTYTPKTSIEAAIKIPAESVTGKVEITIKLESAQPTSVDIKGINCVGCTVNPDQTAALGVSEFVFAVTLDEHYAAPTFKTLKINNVTLKPDVDYKATFIIDSKQFKVGLLNGKKVNGTIEVTILGEYIPPSGDTTISLPSGSGLWLCDTHDFHFPDNETKFDAIDGCKVRIEMQKPATTTGHVPLGIRIVTGGTTLNYDQYDYYFVDDEVAELVITPDVAQIAVGGTITIAADPTLSIAQFIYSADSGSITLSFQATEEGCYMPSIDWGDDDGGEESIAPMEVGKTYSKVHTFEDDEGVYVINVTQGSGPAPKLIGLNVNNDIRPGSNIYPDINASPANYASGIGLIKSARISNAFTGFIEEGLARTEIKSFCIPSTFTNENTESKHLANCRYLTSIYASSKNTEMCTDDAHKLLFTKLPDNKLTVKTIANDKSEGGIVLDKYNDMPIVGVQSFAAVGRSIGKLTFGEYCNPQYMDYGLLACANVEILSVVESNPYFITDTSKDYATALVTPNDDGVYSIYATTNRTTLADYEGATEFILLPYSISGMQDINSNSKPVTLHPYSIYSDSSLEWITVGDVDFNGDLIRDEDPYHLPAIYDCEILTSVILNSIVSTKCLTSGLIQKCPSVTELKTNAQISGYYGTNTNTIYYADGKKQGAAIVVATCSASLLADPDDQETDWYINNFAPYVFNGNAFGTNRGQVAPAYIYITEKVTSLSEYACVGMSGNAKTHLSIATDNDTYDVQNTTITGRGTQRCVISGENFSPVVSLYFAMLEDSGMDTFMISRPIGTVEAGTMISDEAITTLETAANKNDTVKFKDEAFYNCQNLRTIDLSSLNDNVVPEITSTRAFIQEECTPFSPKDIKVIVNPKSANAFKEHLVWSQFNIIPANI